MRFAFIALFIVFLAACGSSEPAPAATPSTCKLFEIPTSTGCCRDLNENNVCDTVDFASEIETEKQQEYEDAAAKAREKAEQAGKLKRTVVNALYDNASMLTDYRFVYDGDEVVIANGSVVRKLVNEHDLGIQEINGRREQIRVNHITLDFVAKKATSTCVPKDTGAVQLERSSVCDNIIGQQFTVPYDTFTVKLPLHWLADFLHRTPFEELAGTDVGKRKTVLYRFTALNDSRRITSIWVDTQTQMPLKIEVQQGDSVVQQEIYSDFYPI